MTNRASDFRGLILPVLVALVLTLVYFVATGNWTRLNSPLAGIVAVTAGVLGFIAGAARDRYRRSARAKIANQPAR